MSTRETNRRLGATEDPNRIVSLDELSPRHCEAAYGPVLASWMYRSQSFPEATE